jgi:hypothetical protein
LLLLLPLQLLLLLLLLLLVLLLLLLLLSAPPNEDNLIRFGSRPWSSLIRELPNHVCRRRRGA